MSLICGYTENGKMYSEIEFEETTYLIEGTNEYSLFQYHPVTEFELTGWMTMACSHSPKYLVLNGLEIPINADDDHHQQYNFKATEMPNEVLGGNPYLPEHLAGQYVNFSKFDTIKLRIDADPENLSNQLTIRYKYLNIFQLFYSPTDSSPFIVPMFHPVHEGWWESITEEIKEFFGFAGITIGPHGKILD